jgi:iron complex transport system substrate-binding protein
VSILSLLPSATEIVYALGLGDQLCGVSFDCDYPAEVHRLPVVSTSALPASARAGAAEIDAAVRARIGAGESIYTLDGALIRSLDPDLILAQDLCRVCAVPSGDVQAALEVIGCSARVLSLDPNRLEDVIQCIGAVGGATGTADRAEVLMATLRRRIAAVRRRCTQPTHPRVLVLEWPDPPFNAGHWVPDMVQAAGGVPILAEAGVPSRRLSWDEVTSESIDITVFAPCGYDLEGAVTQAQPLLQRADVAALGSIYAVDANAHFSRPGPRVVDGVELLGALLHRGDPDQGTPEGARLLREPER